MRWRRSSRNRIDLQGQTGEWRYAGPAVFLHWLLALVIAGMISLGLYMTSIEDEPNAPWYFNLHKTVGMLAFVLVLVRAMWRLTHRPAALPATVPKWEISAASVVQRLLYACMFLIPVAGFLGASYSKSGVSFFGLRLPAWRVPDHDTAEFFFGLHKTIIWVLVALVLVHALGGLKHLLLDKDRVFQRMWF